MAQPPLTSLGFPAPVLAKLRALGIESPDGLRSMMLAAPEDLRRFLGVETFSLIWRLLESIPDNIPPSDFRPAAIVHGARLDKPPGSPASTVDLTLRDRLYAELQELRRSRNHRQRERIRELEARLNALLEEPATE